MKSGEKNVFSKNYLENEDEGEKMRRNLISHNFYVMFLFIDPQRSLGSIFEARESIFNPFSMLR